MYVQLSVCSNFHKPTDIEKLVLFCDNKRKCSSNFKIRWDTKPLFIETFASELTQNSWNVVQSISKPCQEDTDFLNAARIQHKFSRVVWIMHAAQHETSTELSHYHIYVTSRREVYTPSGRDTFPCFQTQ